MFNVHEGRVIQGHRVQQPGEITRNLLHRFRDQETRFRATSAWKEIVGSSISRVSEARISGTGYSMSP